MHYLEGRVEIGRCASRSWDVEVDGFVQSPEDEVEESTAEAGGFNSFAVVFVSVASDGTVCCEDYVVSSTCFTRECQLQHTILSPGSEEPTAVELAVGAEASKRFVFVSA